VVFLGVRDTVLRNHRRGPAHYDLCCCLFSNASTPFWALS
jgi:hypothetical protein